MKHLETMEMAMEMEMESEGTAEERMNDGGKLWVTSGGGRKELEPMVVVLEEEMVRKSPVLEAMARYRKALGGSGRRRKVKQRRGSRRMEDRAGKVRAEVVVLEMVDRDTLELVGAYLKGEFICPDSFRVLALCVLQAADFLMLWKLMDLAARFVGGHLRRVQSLDGISAVALERVMDFTSGQDLLHAETLLCSDGVSCLEAEEKAKLIQAAWARAPKGRVECVEEALRKQRRFSTDPRQGNLVDWNQAKHFKFSVKRTSWQELSKLLEEAPQLTSLDCSANKWTNDQLCSLLQLLEKKSLLLKSYLREGMDNNPAKRQFRKTRKRKQTRELGATRAVVALNLNLSSTGLSDTGLEEIAAASAVRFEDQMQPPVAELDLQGNALGDIGARSLAVWLRKFNYSELSLCIQRNSRVTESGLSKLGRQVQLQRTALTELDVSDMGVDMNVLLTSLFHPRRATSLRRLKISNNFSTLSAHALKSLAGTQQTCLVGLNLSGNLLEDKAWDALALGLEAKRFPLLQSLELSNMGMQASHAKSVVQGLVAQATVQFLDVSRNQLKTRGTAAFAGLVGSALSRLDVSGNKFDVLVGGAFGAALAKAPSGLEELRLGVASCQQERLRIAGCAALCRGLLSLTQSPLTLCTLDLSGHSIQCKGALVLANAISRTATLSLRNLLLRENSIRDQGAFELASVVFAKVARHKDATCELGLSDNPISSGTQTQLKWLVHHRFRLIL